MKYFIDTEFIEGFHKPLFGKRRHFIDLISIGIVAEDGREYYAVSNEFNPRLADKWVRENVIGANMELDMLSRYSHGDNRNTDLSAMEGMDSNQSIKYLIKKYGKTNKQISWDIIEFVTPTNEPQFCINEFGKWDITYQATKRGGSLPEFYGYYSDYDWVLFCSLFGRMIDLPKGFPMYCIDLKQSLDDKVRRDPNIGTLEKNTQRVLSFDDLLRFYKTFDNYPKQTKEHNALADARWNRNLYKFLQEC